MKKKDKQFHNEIRLADGRPLILRWTDLLYIAIIGVFTVICLELFHRMIVVYNDKYHSDIGYYIRLVSDGQAHQKRLIEFVFSRLYGINQITMEINVYLAVVIAAVIVLNFLMIRWFLKEDGIRPDRSILQLLSLTAIFMGPIYVPVFHEWYYRFSFQSFAWHSPTQQSMVLFSLIATLCFLKLFVHYDRDGVKPLWWLACAVTMFISVYAKPSFFIDLVPAVCVLFLIELIRGGKEGFLPRLGKLFLIGCSLIPGGIYMLVLNRIEYSEDAEEPGNGIAIDISHFFEQNHLLAGFLCGLAFAIVVFCVNFRRIGDRKYQFALLIFIFGLLQCMLLTETGPRANHGNFNWGRDYGDYYILLVSLVLALENFLDKDFMPGGRPAARKIYLAVIGILFLLHVLSQMKYFYLILTGHGYYI